MFGPVLFFVFLQWRSSCILKEWDLSEHPPIEVDLEVLQGGMFIMCEQKQKVFDCSVMILLFYLMNFFYIIAHIISTNDVN